MHGVTQTIRPAIELPTGRPQCHTFQRVIQVVQVRCKHWQIFLRLHTPIYIQNRMWMGYTGKGGRGGKSNVTCRGIQERALI